MIIGIILAAGSSTRFGSDKRKSLLPTGHGVLEQTIINASASVDQCIVVLRATDHDFAKSLAHTFTEPAVEFYLAPDSAAGMAHSLANAIGKLPTCEGVIIFLGDMPYLGKATIEQLLAAFKKHRDLAPIIVPTIDAKNSTGVNETLSGHPVIFSAAYFDQLARLTGDNGAKPVIKGHPDNVIRVMVNDPGILQDIDRPTDLISEET